MGVSICITWFIVEYSKVSSFTCVRWLFWHMPSTNPVGPVHCTIASN